MPPNDSNSKALWLIVEGVIGAMLMLCIVLITDVRSSIKEARDERSGLRDRVTVLEGRMTADEADEFTSRDALEVWREISALAKESAGINPAVAREFQHIDRRVETLEVAVSK